MENDSIVIELTSSDLGNRKMFNLKAFSRLKDDDSNINLNEIYSQPINVAILKDTGKSQVNDDGVIKRIFLPPLSDNNSTRTMPTKGFDQKYYYPSNTIVASNGCVYHVEPFMLPPPQKISAIMKSISNLKVDQNHSFGSSKKSDEITNHAKTNGRVIDKDNHATSFSDDFPDRVDLLNEDSPRGGEAFLSLKDFSVYTYIKMEMLGTGSQPHQLDSDAFEKIRNFLNVPVMVEQVISFGMFVCFDAFLYVITYLPIRVCISSFYLFWDSIAAAVTSKELNFTMALKFRRVYAFDLIRGILLLIGSSVLRLLHMSRVYHYIRGQTIIKLYVLTSMLEVLDRLFGSFGQDLFESLYVQTNKNPMQLSVLATFLVTAIYVVIHSSIYFIHIATLLVTVNSAEQALLAVLFLNNFSEIRSFVFKKFDRISVMQLSFADTTERFQLMLFLILITLVSLAQTGLASLYSNLNIFLCMMFGESLADWMKHAFISKFNSLDSSVYADMSRVLRSDIIRSFKDKMVYDHNYAVIRRVGLSQVWCKNNKMINIYF